MPYAPNAIRRTSDQPSAELYACVRFSQLHELAAEAPRSWKSRSSQRHQASSRASGFWILSRPNPSNAVLRDSHEPSAVSHARMKFCSSSRAGCRTCRICHARKHRQFLDAFSHSADTREVYMQSSPHEPFRSHPEAIETSEGL